MDGFSSLAADFHNNRIDVFDGQFHRVALSPGQFADSTIPNGFAPFNVQAVGQSVYVAYAQQDSHASTAKNNGGFVDVYTDFGATRTRIASNGTLSAPWGLAIAPASFGSFAGALLVGNLGDGRINVYQGSSFQGQLTGINNQPVRIQQL